MGRILFIVLCSFLWILIGQFIPDKYIISVMGVIGWWTAFLWIWLFPSDQDKKLRELSKVIKIIKKNGGFFVHATKEQSQEFLEKLNEID